MKKLLSIFVIVASFFFTVPVVAQNVGINNLSPNYPLDILKTGGGYSFRLVNPSSTTGSTVGLLFSNNAAYGNNTLNSASIHAFRAANGGQGLSFGTSLSGGSPTERMRIDSAGNMHVITGNIGLGLLSSSYDLYVAHANPSIGFYDDDDDQFSGSIVGDSTNLFINSYRKSALGNNTAGNLILQTGSSFPLLLSPGNVGIGTSDPLEKVDVKGNLRLESTSNTTGAIIRMYGGTDDLSFIQFFKNLGTPTSMGYLGYSGSAGYSVWSSGTAAFLNSDGLGISTSSPLTKLHIIGGQDAGLGNTSNGYLMLGSGTSSNIIIDNNEIMARSNGAVAPLTLQNDGGSVRIGNVAAPAGYLFAVKGKAICEELKVQLSGNWPDYVFHKNYRLKSFDELREYIAANNHLPNIPAASEVEKNGIEVGDMQKKMMEKIEELTLYVLQLEEQVKEMKKQIAHQ